MIENGFLKLLVSKNREKLFMMKNERRFEDAFVVRCEAVTKPGAIVGKPHVIEVRRNVYAPARQRPSYRFYQFSI